MNIYQINFLMIIFYAFLFLLVAGKVAHIKKIFIIAVTVQLIIISGLRDPSIGIDTYRYERHFNNIGDMSSLTQLFKYGMDLGYVLLQKIVSVFTSDFQIWLVIVAILVYVSLGVFIYKYSKAYLFSYLLFLALGFFHFSLSGLRQSIALIIVLWSYKFILNKEMAKFLFIVILASLFHSSAILFIPMYFLAHIKWNKMYFMFLLTAYTIFLLFRNQIGYLLTLVYYAEDAGIVFNTYESSQGIGGLTLLLLFILVLGVFIYNPFKSLNKENTVLSNILLMAFFIQSLSSFSYLFTRLNMYYLIFIIIYLPFLLNNLDKMPIKLTMKEEQGLRIISKFTLIIIITIYYFSIIKVEMMPGLLPYKFFWQ